MKPYFQLRIIKKEDGFYPEYSENKTTENRYAGIIWSYKEKRYKEYSIA